MENTQLTTKNETTELAKQLNESVFSVIGSDNMIGFEKAYQIATAAQRLTQLLTPEYMKPIMALQNNRLGFKTDKSEGYPESVVKNCLIEAVLTGVQPFGNQFNIIAGNCYITKEGFGHLLNNFKGLDFDIVPKLPRINADATSAAIAMVIEWTINGETKTKEIDIPVKMNKFMGTDAVIGKATRKARAWLFNRISGIEVGDGDVTDIDHKDVTKAKPDVTFEELNLLLESKMGSLTKAEADNAKRIMDNKETGSYNKLHALLTEKSDV